MATTLTTRRIASALPLVRQPISATDLIYARPPRRTPKVTLPAHLSHRSLSLQSVLPVLTPSFWKSMVPKPLRRQRRKKPLTPEEAAARARTREPSQTFIIVFIVMFIGSMAIQLIQLKMQATRFSLQTELKLRQLRETVRRVRNGEDVDVEKALGTGDEKSEKEWEEAIRELEEEDAVIQSRKMRRRQRRDALRVADEKEEKRQTGDILEAADQREKRKEERR